ncbi:MAG TPA: serine/threonine-protein kinase [Solirubrobacteraceae bacterium]|nr:serine/threonine-protein kinase [Solirubrobacteraceae bacterium]
MGEYRIDSLVAVGGMGKVYRATAGDGTAVALKLVNEDLARDETFRRRFRREARIAQTVRNPHVVPVRDTGEHEGVLYLAAQLIDGTTLDERLQQERRLDLESIVRICTHVADGLQALWEAGMVHRDVKPANILIDRDGNAHITDFGLAKDSQGTVLTRPGQALGTIDYMAPEQIRGEPVTGATDTYALGCVVYECVCGRPPFAHREGMNVLWAHLQDEPPDPSARRRDIPPAFMQALQAALRKEPAERPRTSVEYARSLARAAGLANGDRAG